MMPTRPPVSGSRKSRIGTAILALAASAAFMASPQAFAQARPAAEKPFDLAAFLQAAAASCARLESVALDFVCREEIEEKIDMSKDIENPPETGGWIGPQGEYMSPRISLFSRSSARYRHSLVYDYQCVRDFQGDIRDRRNLLEENGKKKTFPEAKLATVNFSYGRSLLAPVGLFAERFQGDFEYAVAGRDKIDGKPAVIIEAKPRPDVPVRQNLFGKAWVDPESGDILKIEWDESRIGRYDVFLRRGEKYGMRPEITVITECSVAKNGLRFPTRTLYEEAYLNTRGRKFVRSTTTVVYSEFKFFTVDVEIK